MRFDKVNPNLWKTQTHGTGVIVSNFDPQSEAPFDPANILFAVEDGGFSVSAKREMEDKGDGIANVPPGTYQLQEYKPMEASISGTAVNITKETLPHLAPGIVAETVSAGSAGSYDKFTFDKDMKLEDFREYWLLIDYSDKHGESDGGMMAYHIKHALNVDGFSAEHADGAFGKFPFNLKAFYDLENLDEAPMEIYMQVKEDAVP